MPFKNIKFLILFVIGAFLEVSCGDFANIQKTYTPEEKMVKAIEYYNKGDNYKAGVLLEEIVPILKGKAEAEDALYYLANNYFKQEQYMMSAYYFKDFYLTYPRSKRVEESMFMYVKSLYLDSPAYNLDQTNTYDCMKAMSNFLVRYPKSEFAEQCNTIADELNKKLMRKSFEHSTMYHKVGNYKSAVVALSNFIKEYATSPYAEEAHYLRFYSQHKLAKNSIEGKIQEDRFYLAVEFYHTFVDKYPDSKYKKSSEGYYDSIMESLEEIKSKK
jgi:outer membrane protein assembly factor BamD